ncbi:BadF/BadG/BcrA/BcrD ATPase family protein [Peribacillus alkalitolerans]|uniref:BadF/BadG/BcrA/BcrD ATPase family protein n=1 Tax=Peribacillus alkalitolerans TaxID=1550385 RepID=UPI0013D4799E|nr:BadF/BadG/BcrA/BcrD ATPase family protein [Peribacillus alkalitolerans]
MKKYVIGVDAGGTKTEAAAYTLLGEFLCTHVTDMGNIAVNLESATEHIKAAIRLCLSELTDTDCVGIIIGVAGGGIIERTQALKEFLAKEFTCPISIVNDVLLNYYSVMGKQDGVLVVAGTGSICLGKNQGEFNTVGGWGHLLGDEGSAYDIGLKALKTIIHDDHKGELSPFSRNILTSLSMAQPQDVKAYVYQGVKKDIAKIASLVDLFAQGSDHQAIRILQDAGIELAKQAILCIQKSKLSVPLSIGIKGSVIENCVIVRQSFMDEINKRFNEVQFISIPNRLGSFGGYKYWKDNLK